MGEDPAAYAAGQGRESSEHAGTLSRPRSSRISLSTVLSSLWENLWITTCRGVTHVVRDGIAVPSRPTRVTLRPTGVTSRRQSEELEAAAGAGEEVEDELESEELELDDPDRESVR
ncbi:hypothetical protein GCM10007979_05670 [Nocardioides albus]|nr:hypothetical protein GCM10007979_05670 [Nocardioides albus]